jgi:hypothetical protein
VKHKAFGWLGLKIGLFGLFAIAGVLAGLMVGPGFFRFSIMAFVWAGEIVLIHWVVEGIHRVVMKKRDVIPSETKGILTPQVRKGMGIVSIVPMTFFLILILAVPDPGLGYLPIGFLAGASSMLTGGLSISWKKPYLGWIGFGMALILYLFVLIGFLTSL